MTPYEKQDALVDLVNSYFTRSIIAQADSAGKVVFTTNTAHNFIVGDYVKLFDVIDDDNNITTYNAYAPKLTSTKITAINAGLNQITLDLAYNALIDITDLKVRSVYVYTNDQSDIFISGNAKNYPICVIDYINPKTIPNGNCKFINGESPFMLTVADDYTKYGTVKNYNTKLRESRAYVIDKFEEVMALFGKKIDNNGYEVGETTLGGVETSLARCDILY
jgi:hypothetical protein